MITNDLISNPIGWADKAVGTNKRFLFLVVLQVLMGVMMAKQHMPYAILFTIFSIMYLYALKKVLEELKKKS